MKIYKIDTHINKIYVNKLTVNVCAIDLSNAFDKVNHSALLLKLLQRKFPDNLLRFFKTVSIIVTRTCVKWNSMMSSFFKIEFGVRQGLVLSPHLFSIFISMIL